MCLKEVEAVHKKTVLELELTCQRGSSSKSSLTWEKRMLRVMALLSSSMVSKSCSSNCKVRLGHVGGPLGLESIFVLAALLLLGI